MNVVETEKILSWINERKKSLSGKTSRIHELNAVEREIRRLSVPNDFSLVSRKGIEARTKKYEEFYEHIIPIIRQLRSEGKKTAYAITNALNDMGEKTVKGRAFRTVIVSKLMKLADERSSQLDLVNQDSDNPKQ